MRPTHVESKIPLKRCIPLYSNGNEFLEKKFETSLDIMVFDKRVICKIIFTAECFWVIVDDLLSENKFDFRINNFVFDNKITLHFGPLRR